MTRILSFVLACGSVAFGGSRSETTTYVEGNIAGIAPNTGGTLVVSDEKTMYFRTGLATVAVPYTAISKAELGATREVSHGAPIYKVWARHKKTETQFLKVEFKSEDGEEKSMTLELAQASAPAVLTSIQEHQGNTAVAKAEPAPEAAPAAAPAPVKAAARPAPVATAKSPSRSDAGAKASPPTKPGSDWWGDSLWKTTSNASTWTKPAGAIAPEE
ncbi:MAG TPA: hypothetical protein VMT15_03050 [Bryobacteraceae bacterium]|nr:hypothetical protein [Bryobacteraceae bacterium]